MSTLLDICCKKYTNTETRLLPPVHMHFRHCRPMGDPKFHHEVISAPWSLPRFRICGPRNVGLTCLRGLWPIISSLSCNESRTNWYLF